MFLLSDDIKNSQHSYEPVFMEKFNKHTTILTHPIPSKSMLYNDD